MAHTRRTVLAAGLAAGAGLVGCSSASEGHHHRAAAGPAHPAGAPDTLIMLIRHAEKPYAGDVGEDDEGNDDPGSLALRGRRRAEALPGLFPPAARAPLPRPASLFVPSGSPARCRQTVAPLAEALKLPIRAPLPAGREADLACAALAAPGPVLICWEHTGLPRVVQALGAAGLRDVPALWPDRYDLVWLLTRHRGAWSFREQGQHLLPGDP
ncbi:hypothetical protein [Streptomyces antimicrobicus]|uniref:Histidine phosphatase family protein n=1 Tax=Streptomyces antimicrobicus TaxID=2883108 RepID=A0ABS8B6V9_9ACTN|nr:hypothetical protein [Streptomyces antimicrobicus]MCB5180332.1 hypothetical protein [Streptomyces antimicrobicus]